MRSPREIIAGGRIAAVALAPGLIVWVEATTVAASTAAVPFTFEPLLANALVPQQSGWP
jgi:hypothetical protein